MIVQYNIFLKVSRYLISNNVGVTIYSGGIDWMVIFSIEISIFILNSHGILDMN